MIFISTSQCLLAYCFVVLMHYYTYLIVCVPSRQHRSFSSVSDDKHESNLTVDGCYIFLSTHADRQGVDISFTVFVCFCLFFVRLRISPPRIKLVASNFARRFIGVQGRESYILRNFASPKAQNRTSRPARALNYK